MSLRTLVFSILCGIAYSASGTTPPYIPPETLPPSTNPVLPPNPPVHVARLDQSPLTRKHVQGLHLSGTAHALLMRQFAASPNVTALAPPLARSRGRRPVASVETYATTPARVSDDGFQDVEPQTVSAVYGFRGRWTVFAYAKFVRIEGAMWPQLYTRRTANLSTFGAEQPLPLVAPYTISYDAALAVNPYGGGVAGYRTYCVGIIATTALSNGPTAVAMWASDDAGETWYPPTVVATRSGNQFEVDKPWVHVSWWPGYLGTVYFGWTDVDLSFTRNPNGTANSVWFRRLDNDSFGAPVQLQTGDVQDAQIADDNNGQVFFSLVNFSQNNIQVRRSSDRGVTWNTFETISTGRLHLGAINGSVRAETIPIMRFNYVSNKMMLVWHGDNGAGLTDVFYSSYPCSTSCNAASWTEPPVTVNDVPTNDQFMPAVDNNNAGNAVVVFYDRRNDASNVLYDEYYAYLDANGARLICDLSNNGNCRMTTFLSDPGIYSSQNGNARFIGDYQAVWSDSYEDGESATAAFIALTTIPFQGDTWFGRVLY